MEVSITGRADASNLPSAGKISPSVITARIGPTEQSAIRPNESSPARLSLRMEDTPTPIAMMKGTVIGPVVTPPESKATARKSRGTKAASANTSM